jgi:hypothetical protein
MNDLEHADEFNEKISDYLFWYNAKRPYYALGQMTPIECIKMNEKKYRGKCNMLWTHTEVCLTSFFMLVWQLTFKKNIVMCDNKRNDILSKITNHDQWPNFVEGNHLLKLEEIADDAFSKGTIEGYLATLLIYHQLCEEIAQLLIRDSQFFLELSVHPTGIKFQNHKQMMFGKVLSELEYAIEFERKNEFITKCREFNTLRNKTIHKLTKQAPLNDLKKQLGSIKKLYTEIWTIFDVSHDWFQLCFKDFKKDKFIDYIEDEQDT